MNRNIKEIAKLRGSEDLWEVAKLHNHESVFPMVRPIENFLGCIARINTTSTHFCYFHVNFQKSQSFNITFWFFVNCTYKLFFFFGEFTCLFYENLFKLKNHNRDLNMHKKENNFQSFKIYTFNKVLNSYKKYVAYYVLFNNFI